VNVYQESVKKIELEIEAIGILANMNIDKMSLKDVENGNLIIGIRSRDIGKRSEKDDAKGKVMNYIWRKIGNMPKNGEIRIQRNRHYLIRIEESTRPINIIIIKLRLLKNIESIV